MIFNEAEGPLSWSVYHVPEWSLVTGSSRRVPAINS